MKREWKNRAGSGEWCGEPVVWACLSLLLLGWGRAHAEMRVKAWASAIWRPEQESKKGGATVGLNSP